MSDTSAITSPFTSPITSTLERLRADAPLVQCLTNYVSMDLAANLLNAAGASPAMVHDHHEAAELASVASAVVVNIGTLSDPWIAGMIAAAEVARERGIPWVLDPVAVGATRYRRSTAQRLLEYQPTVIRGNASEIVALSTASGAGRGVDSLHDSTAIVDQAGAFASQTGAVVVVSGATDVVTDGERTVRVTGGDPRMPLISALGCSATALVAACVAVATTPTPAVDGAVAAMAMLAAAGGIAGERSAGPGTLRAHLLDALADLSADQLTRVQVR